MQALVPSHAVTAQRFAASGKRFPLLPAGSISHDVRYHLSVHHPAKEAR